MTCIIPDPLIIIGRKMELVSPTHITVLGHTSEVFISDVSARSSTFRDI